MSCDHDFDTNEESEYCHKGCGEKWSIWKIKELQKYKLTYEALKEANDFYAKEENWNIPEVDPVNGFKGMSAKSPVEHARKSVACEALKKAKEILK